MYICPICSKEFEIEEQVSKHLLLCWREHNPNHKPKQAPRKEDIVIRKMDPDISNFFNSFRKDK